MNDGAYTKKELLKVEALSWPDRGELCPKCNVRIPQFNDLTADQIEQLRSFIRNGEMLYAVRDLRRFTGCSYRWAVIWCHHIDGSQLGCPVFS
jgi:hypothetical protein